MSSGNLPLTTYHRAESLGSGSYGSVITVYDDDGEEFALKLFEVDEDDDDNTTGIDIGALREISVLRLFRGENAHPNIIAIHDVQTAFGDDQEQAGAGTDGYLALAMPRFAHGSLTDAMSKITTKQQKVTIAHGILSSVAHLHENSIMHRDIKGDNILLNDSGDDMFQPVLIDFSLAKIVDPSVVIPGFPAISQSGETDPTHTPSTGTPTYRAPEVLDQEEYGLASDLWSVGVVLLELLRGKCLEATKDKSAILLITEYLKSFPNGQPFPTLIRNLLQVDPEKRWTARQALDSELFQKHSLRPNPATFRRLDISHALPFEGEDDDQADSKGIIKKSKNKRVDSVLAKRFTKIQKICHAMEWHNPMTAQTALTYSIQMSELCDVDEEDQVLLDCVVLAHKFFERHLSDLEKLSDEKTFRDWDLEEFVDNESTLFMMMDFCLYPRRYIEVRK